jgi:hypothetical protein
LKCNFCDEEYPSKYYFLDENPAYPCIKCKDRPELKNYVEKSITDQLNEQKEFRFSNPRIAMIIITLPALILGLSVVDNPNFFLMVIIGIALLLLLFIYELYSLPFKIKVNKNQLIFKSHKGENKVLLSEIRKIGYAYPPIFLKFHLKDGNSIRLGSIVNKDFFYLIQKQEPSIKISKSLLKFW